MMTTLYVVRAPKRRTHLLSIDGQTLCGHTLSLASRKRSDAVEIDMAGGATTRVVTDFKREFNDDTCCKRCTRILRMLVLCHVTRDRGTR